MRHVDPERLTLLALDEESADAERSHLADCAVCRQELATLREVVARGRETEPDDLSPPPPPPAVWDAIRMRIPAAEDGTRANDGALIDVDRGSGGNRRRTGSRRRRVLTAVAAGAVGILLGVAATLGWQQVRAPERTVLASTALAPLDATGGTGDARLVRTGDQLTLEIDVRNLPLTNGFYEAWMFVPGTTKMQAMGSVRPGELIRFPIPPGLDPAGWRGIDISAEPFDGDPAHSATSVLRGELRR